MSDLDNVISLRIQIDDASAVSSFQSIESAAKAVGNAIDDIQTKSSSILPGTEEHIADMRRSTSEAMKRIDDIEKEYNSSTTTDYRRELLSSERTSLLESINATFDDLRVFQSLSQRLSQAFGNGRGLKGISELNQALPQLLSFANQYAGYSRNMNVLSSDKQMMAGVKSYTGAKEILRNLGVKENSQTERDLLQYVVQMGVSQSQRSDYISRIAGTSQASKHMFNSFKDMLPTVFQAYHVKHRNVADSEYQTLLTHDEHKALADILNSNPYFAQAAEKAGFARRLNGRMGLLQYISRGQVNASAGSLYDMIVSAAKGMPMYGITDVDDPDAWDKIARKTNKQMIGSINAARYLSDLQKRNGMFSWLAPGQRTGENIVAQTPADSPVKQGYYDIGKIGFSPSVKRYEVARYTLANVGDIKDKGLHSGVNLNGKERLYGDGHEDDYFALDHSLHLENIFKHRNNGVMPQHNEAIDDVIYLAADPRLADPNLDKAKRAAIEEQYANWINQGITKNVRGRDVHYVATRVNQHTGVEFVAEPLYNKIMKEDPTYFSAGLNQEQFKTWEEFAKAMEYRNKNATTGEMMNSLYGTSLPKDSKQLKIAIVDWEKAAKGLNGNGELEIGAGMNGASFINSKYLPESGQARLTGVKTALSRMNFEELAKTYGGKLVLPKLGGGTIRITGDEDFVLSASDVKNAGLMLDQKMSYDEIVENIKEGIGKHGVSMSKTMGDANGKIRWLSGQLAQILSGDESF